MREFEKSSRWVVNQTRKPGTSLRIICFHYGGGSASVFRNWSRFLSPTFELLAVQLPGREGRFKEPLFYDFEALNEVIVKGVEPYLDRPYVVFGHSLGAINSFEFLRVIKNKKLRQPLLFLPSGMPAPHLKKKEEGISSLSDEEFVEVLNDKYEETLGNVLSNTELRNMFLPQLRADFSVLESYRYKKGPQLNCPIIALAGTEEISISDKQLNGWAKHTTDYFKSHRFAGGHFFVHSAEAQVVKFVCDNIKNLDAA